MSLYEDIVSGKEKVSLVGLGYVGMPIAVAFARKIQVVGFDLNAAKIDLYKSGIDPTNEVGDEVIITNLWDTTTYEVVEIKIIMPNEVEKILIQPGRELVTLMTCHPYASGGRQRYLVICEPKEIIEP